MTTTTIVLMPHSELLEKFKQLMRRNRNFTAVNTLASGDKRKWTIAPKGGRKLITGSGSAISAANIVKVFDIHSAGARGPKGRFQAPVGNGWRSLNTATLSEVKIGHVIYRVV